LINILHLFLLPDEVNAISIDHAVKFCGAVGSVAFFKPCFFDHIQGQHLFSEISFVDRRSQDELVDLLPLA